jgi:polysaccharide biosynthesis/export protein ExoF
MRRNWNFRLEPLRSGQSTMILAGLFAVFVAGFSTWPWASGHNSTRDRTPKPPAAFSSLSKTPLEMTVLERRPGVASPALRYALGDRLKVTLFEKVDLNDDEQSNIPATGLVERTELTGDYVVQENGDVVLPLLGGVEAEGQSPEQLAENLQAAFKRSIGRPAKVSVILLEREPVYLVGKDIKPGTVKYSPGMTILHAIALSGATKNENSELYAHTEYSRGMEKLELATQRLKKALAQAAALRAHRSGQQAEIPARLVELAGQQEAKKLVDAAVTVRNLITAARQPQIASYQASLAAARQETASQANRLALLEEHTMIHVQRRDAIAEIRKHNDGLASALVNMQNEVANVKEKREETSAALAKAHDSVAQAEQKLTKLEADLALELQNEITAADNEIAEQSVSLRSAQQLLADLRIASLRLGGKDQRLTYDIIRRTRQGIRRNTASETTALYPGDLIQVTDGRNGSAS